MVAENVDANDGLVEFGIGALSNVVVEMFLIFERIQTLEDKLEESLQVLRAWTCYENVRVAMRNSSGDSQTEGSRLATTASCSQSDDRRQGFFGDSVDKGKQSLRLVGRLCKFGQLANRLGVSETVLELGQDLVVLALPFISLGGLYVLATGDRQDVEFVVENETVFARTERQEKALIEPRDDRLVRRCPVSCVYILA